MKVLSVMQNKGGVGKTTLSRLLAEYFGRRDFRVLALDLDPQCNFSRRFLSMDFDQTDPDGVIPPVHPDFDADVDQDWSGRSSSAEIYFTGEVFSYPTAYASLEMLPGEGSRLREIELVRADEVKERVHDRLRHFLSLDDVTSAYDLVIVDTSPSKGPLAVSAVRAATHLIIPTTMEPQPVEGLYGMLQMWRREVNRRTEDSELKILGILPNMVRKGVALHEGLLSTLREDASINHYLCPCIMHQRIAFAESDHPGAQPASVFDLQPKDPARVEAEAVCGFVNKQLFYGEG